MTQVQDVRTARTLASDITQIGAKLYDLMEHEVSERLARARALRFLDQVASSAGEYCLSCCAVWLYVMSKCAYDVVLCLCRGVKGSGVHRAQSAGNYREHQAVCRGHEVRTIIFISYSPSILTPPSPPFPLSPFIHSNRKESDELEADQRALESKISKKQEELERTEKRLKSLEHVRPQFMEEAEKLEKELQRYYEVYMEKHRNLDYLEHELEKYAKHEEELMEEQERKLKKMRERLLKEEVELMRGVRRDEEEHERGRGARGVADRG
ncbi:hypothetical protein EON65_16620, partial [archaeon]